MKLIYFLALILFCFYSKANNISILTYNLNYSFINKNVVTILDSLNADVVCLQETNGEWEQIIRNGLADKYPFIYFKNQGTAGGLATLSKYPIINTIHIKNNPGWFPACLVSIKKDEDTIQLLNIHLKPGLTKKGRIGWNAYFKANEIHTKELIHFLKMVDTNLPTIILGDFNENDNGETLQWLREKMKFQDALSKFDKKSKTWRWIILRGRYDHLFFNDLISCYNAAVYKLGKSDHFPVIGEFKIN